jgi:hypothetical protein
MTFKWLKTGGAYKVDKLYVWNAGAAARRGSHVACLRLAVCVRRHASVHTATCRLVLLLLLLLLLVRATGSWDALGVHYASQGWKDDKVINTVKAHNRAVNS